MPQVPVAGSRVLAKLFRRLFLVKLQQLHDLGRLQLFGDHVGLE